MRAEGVVWLEAGHRENGCYRDILRDPSLTLVASDGRHRFLARAQVGDEARRSWLRSELRAKYGLRDWWVGHLIDGTATIPVRLEAVGSD